jgi:hypothetical protein
MEDIQARLDNEARQAVQRVGRTVEARAQWLIDVGYRYKEVQNLSPAEMRALRWEMAVFCSPNRDYEQYRPAPVSEDDVRRWLVRIHNGIQQLTAGRAWGHRLITHYGFWVPRARQQPGSLLRSRADELPRGFIAEVRESDTLHVAHMRKDGMAHHICEALAAVGDRLRRCQRKECSRLFVRQKRQLYCTPVCAGAVRTRRHRAKQRRAKKVSGQEGTPETVCPLPTIAS